MAETVSTATQGEILLTEDMYTKKGVDELLANAVKGGVTPKGSCAFADLPTPGSTNVGWMYDVSDAFTTTSSFVEGAGKNYPAHTNIYVVNPSTNTYKWDVLPGEGPQPYTSNPAANGTASPGSSPNFSRGDHVHPTDTTRAPTSHASSSDTYGKGTSSNYGHVKLSDATDGTAAAASGGTAATPKAVADALSAAKNYADSVKGDANVIEGVKLAGASSALTPSSKIVTIPNAVATGSTGATNGLMTADDKKKLNGIASGAEVNVIESITVGTSQQTAQINSKRAHIPSAIDSDYGVVLLSDSTTSTSGASNGVAATPAAVKAAKDAADSAASAASGVGTRVSAIETAAGTLYTALAGLDATSMTSANAIKTLVSSLLSYLKAFAAASDNDNSTSYSAS